MGIFHIVNVCEWGFHVNMEYIRVCDTKNVSHYLMGDDNALVCRQTMQFSNYDKLCTL